MDYRELARVNGIDNVDRIEVGQQLVIPSATRELPVEVITPTRAREDQPAPAELPADRSPFIWPVEGAVVSAFGPRGETHHDGIDVAAPIGTLVRAARGGRVLYSDELRGYGNLLIIDHGTNSLALLTDAVHMFTDVSALGLTWFALWIGSRPASPQKTFGDYRAEILAAFVNGVVLCAVVAFVLVEAWRRPASP